MPEWKPPWQPMSSAPKNGRKVVLLIYGTFGDSLRWQQEVEGHWIEHNGGGWTWHGMYGEPVKWRELPLTDDYFGLALKLSQQAAERLRKKDSAPPERKPTSIRDEHEPCSNCGGTGYSHHDCGEDCCACLHPEDNVVCDWCGGKG